MSPRDSSNCATAWYARAAVVTCAWCAGLRFAGHRGQEIAVYDAIVHRAAFHRGVRAGCLTLAA